MLVRRMNKQVSMQYSVGIVHANRKSEEEVRDRGGGDNYMKMSGEASEERGCLADTCMESMHPCVSLGGTFQARRVRRAAGTSVRLESKAWCISCLVHVAYECFVFLISPFFLPSIG